MVSAQLVVMVEIVVAVVLEVSLFRVIIRKYLEIQETTVVVAVVDIMYLLLVLEEMVQQ
jgi:hypothetical protein